MAASALIWKLAAVDGVEIEYRTVGAGEPVVLVHAGVFADWFEPLLKEPALAGRYRLVTYHRVGYAGSSHVAGAISIKEQAAQLRSLMTLLRIERAHLVGNSSGANIIMQLALDAPQQWSFGPAEGARIAQPVLLVMGGKSHEVSPVWQQRQDLLTAWLGNAEPFVLDGATHMLHLENPRGLAERLGAFFADHPIR